ncbi:MAG: IclR family transcriptional regulator [Deltaproteobacteria bacterium]|nr:IclR family transcriptional regulator [Deltaproteobacteria bacterium]
MNRQPSIRRNASLEKANRLLLAFAEATPELGVMDLARRVGLNKSTVSRFVATMLELGLLERVDHGRKYRLGLRVFELGSLAARHRPLYAQAEPAVEKLAAQLRETVTLAVLLGSDLVFLHKADRGVDGASAALGRRYPAHCSASGKALLGLLPAAERAEYLGSRLARRTESSIVVPRVLERELAVSAEQGFAVDHQEFMVGVRSIAVPIHDRSGAAVAAIGVSGAARRITPANVPAIVAPLQRVAAEVSRRLGHRPLVRVRPPAMLSDATAVG